MAKRVRHLTLGGSRSFRSSRLWEGAESGPRGWGSTCFSLGAPPAFLRPPPPIGSEGSGEELVGMEAQVTWGRGDTPKLPIPQPQGLLEQSRAVIASKAVGLQLEKVHFRGA